jgi:hypothetical protein
MDSLQATHAGLTPRPADSRFSPRQVRILGTILLVIGTLLAVGVTVLIFNLAPSLMHPGVQVGDMRFTGSAEQGRMVLGLLGWVTLLGAAFAGVGLHQVITARRNKWLLGFVALLIVATVVSVLRVNASLG